MIVTNSLLILAVAVSCSKCQRITLFDFKQEDSQSQCSNGLIGGFDVVVFKCHVDYSEDTAVKYVTFQVKKKSDPKFTFLTDCNIQEDCKNSKNINGTHIDTFVIELVISLNATKSFSGAKLRGNLYTSDNMKMTSNENLFPEISDHTDASGQLIVNGKTINSSDECRESLSRSEVFIIFLCESKVVPCLIEISTNASTDIVHGIGHATWKKYYIFPQEVSVLVKYAICRLNGPSQNFNCIFIIDLKETISGPEENDGSKFNITVLIVVGIAVLMICLSSLLFSYMIYKRRPNMQRKTIQNSYAEEISLDLLDNTQTTNEPQNSMHGFTSCQKKENHERFIPLDKFSKEDLPPMYDTSDLFDLIKCISELTVKVTVNYISIKRPEFYPGTNHTYPFHDKIGTYDTRFGTGLINSVTLSKSGQTCQCHKCLHSVNASKVWITISIITAKALVFDDSEAQKTIFKINFNEENERCHYAEGRTVTHSDIGTDQCEVECVTCDEGLLNLLHLKPQECMQKMADANCKYNKFKDKEKLAIIVSHPHGCPKHVSIGHWINRFVVETVDSIQHTKYIYTTPTCPGCIGACVYILGASDISLKHHVHCGVNEEMNSFSSTGMEKIRIETK